MKKLMNEENKTHEEALDIIEDLMIQCVYYIDSGMYAQSIACLEKIIYTK